MHLITIAMVNELKEVWIAVPKRLVDLYLAQYLPLVGNWWENLAYLYKIYVEMMTTTSTVPLALLPLSPSPKPLMLLQSLLSLPLVPLPLSLLLSRAISITIPTITTVITATVASATAALSFATTPATSPEKANVSRYFKGWFSLAHKHKH